MSSSSATLKVNHLPLFSGTLSTTAKTVVIATGTTSIFSEIEFFKFRPLQRFMVLHKGYRLAD